MPVRDDSEISLDDMFSRSVETGRLLQGELLTLAQRVPARSPEPPPKGVSRLPRLVLRLDRLSPGDVLLSYGGGWKSAVTAVGDGWGKFSHAALWLDPLTTLESDGKLIGPKRARCLGTAILNGERIVLGEIVGAPTTCEVYRHAGMSSISIESFAEALQAEMHASYGKDYSEYYRLVMIARLPTNPALAKHLVRLAAEATRVGERCLLLDKIPGPFCSELVAGFFRHLGLRLYNDDRQPKDVTPNDLSRSALQHVAGAVVDSRQLQDIRYDGQVTEDKYFGLKRTLVEERRELRGTEQAIDELIDKLMSVDRLLNEQHERQFQQMEAIFGVQFKAVLDMMRVSADSAEPNLVRRALRLGTQCMAVAPPLFVAWINPLSDPKAHKEASDNWLRFGRSAVRCMMLQLIWRLKQEPRSDGNGLSQALRRFRHQRKRRRVLKDVQAHRA